MESTVAFNANGTEGDVARDGFRIYVEPEGIYCIRVGDLSRIARPAREGESAGVLAALVDPIFSLLRGNPGRAAGRDLLRTMEEQPLRERLKADPANFFFRADDVVSSAIRSGGGSFWRPGQGTWGFQLRDGRPVVFAFHSSSDRFVAERHLTPLLGDRLRVKGRKKPGVAP